MRTTLREWGRTERMRDAALLVSELVTNAIRYAGSGVELRLTDGVPLRVDVADGSSAVPYVRHARPDDEGGRGMWLLEALADRWGAEPLPTGKRVWFEL